MNSSPQINLLVVLVVSGLQSQHLMDRLTKEKYYFTKMDSTGGMIQESTICLLLGVDKERIDALSDILRECCHPVSQYIPAQMVNAPPEYLSMAMVEARIGGAMMYTMNIEHFEQL